mmetsp:Transcript_28422/g.51340  ORF Transcript_28422/g.51340 Transcript_28422/m.51340 type:complete len:939 (+) Transcript_28422:83-2899(+)
MQNGGAYGPPPGANQYGPPPGGYSQNAPGFQPYESPPSDGGSPGYDPSPAYSQQGFDPMASGMQAQYADMDYTQYTEGAGKSSSGGGLQPRIDPETGVAPRRCTDLVCVLIFIFYWVALLIFLAVVKNESYDGRAYSDVRRLTHGMDYQARLCGIDEGVQDKPFMFFCRTSATENQFWTYPTELNLKDPVCVHACPNVGWLELNTTDIPDSVECLLPEGGTGPGESIQPVSGIPGGQFANVANYFLMFWQRTAYTTPYNSTARDGRYCLPTHPTLQESILTGPLNHWERAYRGIGSFEDCWQPIFVGVVVAVVVSFPYIYIIGSLKNSGKYIITFTLVAVYIAFLAIAIFFLLSVNTFFLSPTNDFYIWYQDQNVFYDRDSEKDATQTSLIIAGVALFVSFVPLGLLLNVSSEFEHAHELTHASFEALLKMQSMFAAPVLLALLKYFILWFFCSNLMTLAAVGTYDDYRIRVEDQKWEGLSRKYYFDHRIWVGIVLYSYGGIWMFECVTSLGQFLISYCSVLFYFTHKVEDEKVPLPRVALDGLHKAFRFHLGSIMLGASWLWLFRWQRMFRWFKNESVVHSDSTCCFDTGKDDSNVSGCTKCIRAIGKPIDSCRGGSPTQRKKDESKERNQKVKGGGTEFACMFVSGTLFTALGASIGKGGWEVGAAIVGAVVGVAFGFMVSNVLADEEHARIEEEWDHGAYHDVVIRAQHYLQAMEKALKYKKSHESVNTYSGLCQSVTIVGVIWIGSIGAAATYGVIANTDRYNDEKSPTFIQDPIIVTVTAFFLCGSIAYDMCALLDHTADALLYCYAFNRKFNKKVVAKFVPEEVRDIVGWDGVKDTSFGMYGKAKPEMYVGTWMRSGENTFQGWTAPPKKKATATAMATQGSVSASQPAGATYSNLGGGTATGAYPSAGYPQRSVGPAASGYPTAGYGGYGQ